MWFLTVTCSCCPYLYFGSAIMLVTYFVNFRYLNDHLFGKELFIRFTARAFRKLPSIYVFSYFPCGFEGRMWDLMVSVPDHCLSFYFLNIPILCYHQKFWLSHNSPYRYNTVSFSQNVVVFLWPMEGELIQQLNSRCVHKSQRTAEFLV